MTARARSHASHLTIGERTITVRPLTGADIEPVLVLERAAYRSPWSPAMFSIEVAKPGALCLGAWDQEDLVAHAVLAPYGGVWHLLNLAVAPSRQRGGLGRAILRDAMRRLEHRAILEGSEPLRITLEVRRGNLAAQRLYLSEGFLAAGVRPRYYPDSGEDAIILWRTPATLRGSLADVPDADPQAAEGLT